MIWRPPEWRAKCDGCGVETKDIVETMTTMIRVKGQTVREDKHYCKTCVEKRDETRST